MSDSLFKSDKKSPLRDSGIGGLQANDDLSRKAAETLRNMQREDPREEAERLRRIFVPLEDLRNAVNPIRVLHQAVESAGIAETGPLLPLLSNVGEEHVAAITSAAHDLLAANVR